MNIDERLENWSRYYRDKLRRQCCGSAEGLYKSPSRQWTPLSEIQHSHLIDWQDAELVEHAWKSMLGRSKLLLKYTYMANYPANVVCRKVRIKPWQYEIEMTKAINCIKEFLDKDNQIE